VTELVKTDVPAMIPPTRNFEFYQKRCISSQLAIFFHIFLSESSVIHRHAKHNEFNFVSKAEVNRPQWQQAKSDAVDFSKYAEQGQDMQNRRAQIICEETYGFSQMAGSESQTTCRPCSRQTAIF
jgi:hypothetical protein